MKRLNFTNAFSLYLLVLGFLFLVYVGGLVIGKSYFQSSGALQQPMPIDGPSISDIKAQLGVFEQVTRPAATPQEQPVTSTEILNAAPAPKAGAADEAVTTQEEPPPADLAGIAADPEPAPETPAAGEGSSAPEPLPTREAETSRTGALTVQVGALTSLRDAEQVMIRLEAKGYRGRLQNPTKDQYYRVWVGEFDTRSEAADMEIQLKADGFLTFITTSR